MKNTIFTESLFPDVKGEFKPKDFLSNFNDEICNIFLISHLQAMDEYNTVADGLDDILRAGFMHRKVFKYLKENLSKLENNNEFIFENDNIGNKRKCIRYKGYTVVIHKEGASHNHTKVEEIIKNQLAEEHILEVSYTLNRFGNEISSIQFSYSKADFCHVVYASNISIQQTPLNKELEAIKPKFKSLDNNNMVANNG